MKKPKIVTKRIVSADGRVVAEARSIVFNAESDHTTVHQTVDVGYDDHGVWCHSSASSSSSTSS